MVTEVVKVLRYAFKKSGFEDMSRCRRLSRGDKRNFIPRGRTCAGDHDLGCQQAILTPPSPYLRSIQVEAGFDVADNRIVQELAAGDLVITADIPLASEVIENNVHALNPRGEFYSKNDMQEHLTMRNFME